MRIDSDRFALADIIFEETDWRGGHDNDRQAPVTPREDYPVVKRTKQRRSGKDGGKGGERPSRAPNRKETTINEFLSGVPDEAAELFVVMYRDLLIDEGKMTIARQSYASAVGHVLGAAIKVVGIDRVMGVVRTLENENQDQWRRLDVAFVRVEEKGQGGIWTDELILILLDCFRIFPHSASATATTAGDRARS